MLIALSSLWITPCSDSSALGNVFMWTTPRLPHWNPKSYLNPLSSELWAIVYERKNFKKPITQHDVSNKAILFTIITYLYTKRRSHFNDTQAHTIEQRLSCLKARNTSHGYKPKKVFQCQQTSMKHCLWFFPELAACKSPTLILSFHFFQKWPR